MSRDLLTILGCASALSCLTACECDRDEPATTSASETEAETRDEGEETAEADEPRTPGPIGRTLAVFDDATVTTRLLVLRRVGAAEGERAEDATALGMGWIGGVERELFLSAEPGSASAATAQLFGPVGACEAPIVRRLVLRGEAEGTEPSRYEALEVRPCEGTSVESIETTHPFGVEGAVEVVALLGDAMEPASAPLAAVLAEAEREAGDGEEMDLVAREIPGANASVAAGWQSYVVRDGAIVGTFEDGIPAYATVGGHTHLLARVGRELRLLTVEASGLTPLEIDAPATAPSGS